MIIIDYSTSDFLICRHALVLEREASGPRLERDRLTRCPVSAYLIHTVKCFAQGETPKHKTCGEIKISTLRYLTPSDRVADSSRTFFFNYKTLKSMLPLYIVILGISQQQK